jgi:hypothetical protein
MNRRVPNGTHGGVRGRKSPLETFSYSIEFCWKYEENRRIPGLSCKVLQFFAKRNIIKPIYNY